MISLDIESVSNNFVACFFAFVAFDCIRRFFCYFAFRYLCRTPPPTVGNSMDALLNSIKHSSDFPTPSNTNAPSVPRPATFEEQLAALEASRGTRIVFLTTKEKSAGLLSFTSSPGICMADARNFVNTLRSFPSDQNIDLIVDTPGGTFAPTEVIINAMLNHKGVISVYVPFRATSAGTLISFAGDRVYLGQNAFLGPVETTWNGWSLPSIARNLPTDGMFLPLWNVFRGACERDAARTANLIRRIGENIEDFETGLQFENTFLNATTFDHDQPLFYQDVEFVCNIRDHSEFPAEIYDIFDKYQTRENKSAGGGGLFRGLL